MDYKQLEQLFSQHEREHPETHLTACITFASLDPEDGEEYPWNSWNARTYAVSSDNDAFQPDEDGYSIYGSSLIRTIGPQTYLTPYISDGYDRKGGLVVEDCCIVVYLLIECSDLQYFAAEAVLYPQRRTGVYAVPAGRDRRIGRRADKKGLCCCKRIVRGRPLWSEMGFCLDG